MGVMLRRLVLAGCAMLVVAGGAHAALTIEITKGIEGALPIAIVPLSWQGPGGEAPEDIARIVQSDLARSGRFSPVPRDNLPSRPTRGEDVNFGDWRKVDADNLVVGRLRARDDGGYTVEFQLFDVYQGAQLAGYSIRARNGELRRVAHHISDLIYERLTGEPGAFNTRIAYVNAVTNAAGEKRYLLKVADADGYDPETILRSPQPIMSPAWSPDGERLAYVSFEGERSAVYIQTLSSGERRKVADFAGINGAPAWGPKGKRLALTLSRGGDPNIFVLQIDSGQLRQITRSGAIDTEPAWSPDGETLAFTSDRGGRPQVYRIPASGGRAERLTFEGSYNARPSFSPDGSKLAMVHQQGGDYRIAVMELESGLLRVLTDGPLDESPSFAPNGSMILYAANEGRRGVLAAVSVDGRVQQRLAGEQGDVREPAWSPLRERR